MRKILGLLTILFVSVNAIAQNTRTKVTITVKDGHVYNGILIEDVVDYYRIESSNTSRIIYKDSVERIVLEEEIIQPTKVQKPKYIYPNPSGPQVSFSAGACGGDRQGLFFPFDIDGGYRFKNGLYLGAQVELLISREKYIGVHVPLRGVVRYYWDCNKYQPYVHASAGWTIGQHDPIQLNFNTQAGGGLSLRLSDHISILGEILLDFCNTEEHWYYSRELYSRELWWKGLAAKIGVTYNFGRR